MRKAFSRQGRLDGGRVVHLDYFLTTGAVARDGSLHPATIFDLEGGIGAVAQSR